MSTIDDWIKKMWFTVTIDYYSALTRNDIWPFATIWMGLENIMQNKISRTEKTNTIRLHLHTKSRKTKQMNKQNETETNSQIERTNGWLPEGEGNGRKRGRELEVPTTGYKMNHRNVTYSIGNIAVNIVIIMYGARWLLDLLAVTS